MNVPVLAGRHSLCSQHLVHEKESIWGKAKEGWWRWVGRVDREHAMIGPMTARAATSHLAHNGQRALFAYEIMRDFSKLDSVPAPLVFFGHTTTLPFSFSSSISQPGDDHSFILLSLYLPHWQPTGYKLLQLYKHLGNRALARKKHVALLTLARKLQFASPHFQRSAPGDPCGFIIATVSVCRAAVCTGTISDLSPLFTVSGTVLR